MRKVTRRQVAGREGVTAWWSVCGETVYCFAIRNTLVTVTKRTNNKSEVMQRRQ